MPRLRVASPYLLASLLLLAGAVHFVFPEPYDGIVPGYIPGPARFWTYASGLAEWVCAAGLLAPSTRRHAATATAVLFVAVFPANIQQAVDAEGMSRVLALARLPLQVPLLLWALQVRRSASQDSTVSRTASAADARPG